LRKHPKGAVSELDCPVVLQHFQPPSFPIEPVVTKRTVAICRETWGFIKKQERGSKSGVVFFYDVSRSASQALI
jgi:hypothetical protein